MNHRARMKAKALRRETELHRNYERHERHGFKRGYDAAPKLPLTTQWEFERAFDERPKYSRMQLALPRRASPFLPDARAPLHEQIKVVQLVAEKWAIRDDERSPLVVWWNWVPADDPSRRKLCGILRRIEGHLARARYGDVHGHEALGMIRAEVAEWWAT